MIVITGASRGIGKYLGEAFTEAGEHVLGTYYTTLPDKNKKNNLTKVDISNQFDVESWINGIKDDLNRITLINCAGINHTALAHKSNLDNWSQVIEVNLIGTFNVIHEILPIMRMQGYGRIINLSSVVAQTFVPGASAYAASKAGLWGMTRSIAIENVKKGITINNINLGYFDIGMISEVPAEYQEKLKNKIPTGNYGKPQNIMSAVRFLMENDYMSGTSIDINGSLH